MHTEKSTTSRNGEKLVQAPFNKWMHMYQYGICPTNSSLDKDPTKTHTATHMYSNS